MRVRVKICGITQLEAIEAAVDAGADALGFVFAPSPRRVTLEQALVLTRAVPPFISRVAVFRHPTELEVEEVFDQLLPDWVQSDLDDAQLIGLDPGSGFLPVLRDSPDAAGAIDLFLDVMGKKRLPVLFESVESGSGRVPNWDHAARLAHHARLVLAGGLTPENVGAAIRKVRPYAVDVSSGVEFKPGHKDPAKIAAFVAAVRAAERELEAGK